MYYTLQLVTCLLYKALLKRGKGVIHAIAMLTGLLIKWEEQAYTFLEIVVKAF